MISNVPYHQQLLTDQALLHSSFTLLRSSFTLLRSSFTLLRSSFTLLIVAPTSAVGRLLLQARLPATHCQTISVIRRLAKTLLGDY